MDFRFLVSNFDMLAFCSRFISGGQSLKNYRLVSRKRLLLASAGITTMDIEAIQLFKQSKNFYDNVKNISSYNKLNVDQLVKLNTSLLQDKIIKGIRTTECWFGNGIEDSLFIPPKPNEIMGMLYLYIDYVNKFLDSKNISEEFLLNSYCKLIEIHPFFDANGRCARALWLSFQKDKNSVPPFIYRLNDKNNRIHDRAVSNYIVGKVDPFWCEMYDWQEKTTEYVRRYLYASFENAFKDIPKSLFTEDISEFLIFLVNQPIFNYTSKNDISINKFRSYIELFESLKIITRRGLKSENKLFFDCYLLSETHVNLENIIVGSFPK